MKQLYFENTEPFGNLYLDYIFYEFENEPILFLCKDEKEALFLCLCSEIRNGQNWLIKSTDPAELKSLLSEEIDIAFAFMASQELLVITMDLAGNETGMIVQTSKIDRLDLPKDGTLLQCDKDDFERYLRSKEWELIGFRPEALSSKIS